MKNERNHLFGTKIKLKKNPEGNGNIVIPFKSEQDLIRIKDLLDL